MTRCHARFFAQFNHTGVGRHCENAYFAMLRNRPPGLTLDYVNNGNEPAVREAIAGARGETDAAIFFWRFDPQFIRAVPGRRLLWWFFESESLPPLWVEQLQPYDEIWAPSTWAREVLAAHGIPERKLRMVPSGVNARIFSPAAGRPERARYVFLSVGKYEKRKSIDEVVAAYQAEFPAAQYPQVELWLKADFPLFPERVHQLAARLAHDARIRVVSGNFSDEQMADLYRSADAFVFPSKAEGFGLPCREEIACGVPAIATCVSAQAVFLDAIDGLYAPVAYDVAPIDDADYRRFYEQDYAGHPLGNWALPRIDSIRGAMRDLYENAPAWREKGLLAAARVREAFSWDAIARQAAGALLERSN